MPGSFSGVYGTAHFPRWSEELGAPGSASALIKELAARHKIFVTGGVVEKCDQTYYSTIPTFSPY